MHIEKLALALVVLLVTALRAAHDQGTIKVDDFVVEPLSRPQSLDILRRNLFSVVLCDNTRAFEQCLDL